MKTLRFLVLGLVMTALVGRAQITSPGWFHAQNPALAPKARSNFAAPTAQFQSEGQLLPLFLPIGIPATPVAEPITPQIQALADGLQDNPQRIFNYVHDHIKFVLYFGSKKGANLTLLEKSGNDFDQSALLVALLHAAGYTNAQYQFGWQVIPYDDPYGDDYDLHHWWQLTLNNTTWTNTVNYMFDLVAARGYPDFYYVDDGNDFEIQRTWVSVKVGSRTYQLDPAFKVSEFVTNSFSLTAAIGTGTTISNALISAAGGTDTGNYAQSLSESTLRGKLTGYTTNLLNYLQSNAPNASVQDVLGGWQITPAYGPWDYVTSPLFPTDNFGGAMPILSWANEPTNIMSTLKITFAGTNYQWFMPQLQGQRLSLTFDNGGNAQLWLDDSNLLQHATSGSSGSTNVVLFAHHPAGIWDETNNVFITGNYSDQITTNAYQRTNSTYALLYAFEPDWGWLQQRQNKLDTYLQQGMTNGSRQVTSETLNVMGLNWMLQTAQTERLLASQLGILPMNFHRLGRMAQETGHGYYVDVYMQLTGEYPSGGDDTAHLRLWAAHFDLNSFFASALEHGIIEQLQNTNLVGASTVKMLEIANTNGQAVYLASSTNWTTGYNVKSHLTANTYDAGTLTTIGNLISSNYYILLPQSGSNHVSGTAGSWAGYGFEARQALGTESLDSQMIISGGYHGGYSSDPIPVDPVFVFTTGDAQPDSFTGTAAGTTTYTLGDPVDAVDGTFQVEHTDLSIGQAEPRGINLSRYYNGTRRFSNPAGMAGGWVHNYAITAATIAAPQAGLGGTTPEQAASMFTATAAAVATYNGGYPNPKNWLTTALIAKWGVDQLTKSGVSVILGKETLQFVKQPNGVFTPPASSTATLTQNGSAYTLQMRHGNQFNFNASGLLTSIVDQYSQSLNLTYNASNWVSTVKDWQNRGTFTFNYSGTPLRLTSVTDGTRTVHYGYATTYNAQGDLTTFTDAEGKPTTYVYDTNHQITATLDALSRLVVTNLYDSQGHITAQYTQGDTNKTWRVYWSGWQTTEFDPAGGEVDYLYDDEGRLTSVFDQLDYETDTYYDGQNHVTYSVSPLNEISQFVYDGHNNLVQSIDPLNFTNTFIFDGNNNLLKKVDPLGNPTAFGYNAQFSLTGLTNGAGDWVNYAYNTDGTLHTRTDSGGATTYGYDSTYNQLNSITYPGTLGMEKFVTSAQGDVTSHTDGQNNVTTFGYDNRRALTNSTGPTNLIVKASFDAVGNNATVSDARGNTLTNTWSTTRRLLATALPATPQGAPIVTNLYDNRDWLVKTLDPYLQPTLYTNDLDGRVISVTDPLSRTATTVYDRDGHRRFIANAAHETNSQTWDARGSLIKLTDGAGHYSTRVYDSAGNQFVLTNRNGNAWHFYFDAANRLTNTVSPQGYSSTLTFNHQGLPAKIVDQANQPTSLYYDGKGRLTNRTDYVTTTYGYDANDNRTNVVENGNTNSWTFDAYNRVSSYRDILGNLIQYRYDANGNVTNLIYPGNRTVTYFYDSLNRMTNVTDWSGRKTAIGYDLDSRITSIVRPNGSYRTINYDVAGQATNILEQMSNGLPIALFHYGWTNSGSMAWEFAAPLPHSGTVPTRTMTYDNDNRLLTVNGASVVNDNNGNLTSGPLTNGVFAAFTYDPRNRLLNAGGVTNVYDALNNRIGQMYGTNTTAYVINPNAKLPQVLMRIKNGVTNYYIYGSGLLYQITEKASGTNTLTYHYDYRGSTIALSADNGLVTDRIEYSAYGLTTYRAGTTDTPFLFNGRFGVQSDPNGLLYMRARYYNPYLCRFMNPDPSGFSAGLNFYAYANGNPTSLLDPFGLNAATSGDTSFDWTGTSENSTPYVTMTLDPNVNTGPQMGPPGFTPAQPYYDPNLPTTMNVDSPNDEAFAQNLAGGIQAASTGLFILSLVTPEGDVAAVGDIAEGTQLYRVFGNEARGLGNYYTTVNPATISDFRTAAGLFPGNSGSFILEGTLNNTEGVILREAAPGPGAVGGGLPEVFVPNPETQINIQRVSGVNPPF